MRIHGFSAGVLCIHSARSDSKKFDLTPQTTRTGAANSRLRSQSMTNNVTESDRGYMARALELARTAEGKTHPNPAVGCVVTNGAEVVGEGFHPKAGAPHAELFALRAAGQAAQGGTAYVTLEPCNHFGRTPPCSIALIEAGISRVRCPQLTFVLECYVVLLVLVMWVPASTFLLQGRVTSLAPAPAAQEKYSHAVLSYRFSKEHDASFVSPIGTLCCCCDLVL